MRRRLLVRFLRGARRSLSDDCDPEEQWPENSLDCDVLALLAEDTAYGDCHG
jgi:hypothetical protein